VESVEGMGDGCGATKMVFSTLATTRGKRERRRRGLRCFMVSVLLVHSDVLLVVKEVYMAMLGLI
jgi:hypothetical protein